MPEDRVYPSSKSLSSSTSSLPLSSSKQISQIYKQASQLFLTRRLQEALSVLEPVITVSQPQDAQQNGDDESVPALAPIATASSNLRIKVWNLYITILNSIVDLGAEEGRRQFAQKEWKALASKVRDGGIWDTVVDIGYRGIEGTVDADVVYNLATILLSHSPSQKLNQQRLENYLSSYGLPHLDVAGHIRDSPPIKRKNRIRGTSGTDTPKNLAARVKILELFTLHVLPRNEEWDYAREFINLSEVLDEERKEAFLQTLDSIYEEKQRDVERAAEIQREKDEELDRQQREDEERRKLAEEQQQQQQQAERIQAEKALNGQHKRASSEVDYGIENGKPSALSKSRTPKSATKSRGTTPPESSKQLRKPERTQNPVRRQVRMFANLVVLLVKGVGRSIVASPMSFLRALLLMVGVIMALGRPDIRDRIRRITGAGWQKLRGTVGMGVKVSYI
ncbi:hypothetical protein AJ80_02193 [Polytolypa hystricis UAMH7299]|uniref:Peroxin 26 n=1 Tax=Polytolypa hystricis (strain UAMH7299) TaxID=1447883 RepID=A0A2B7YRZ5_POLH7|nr:hypothetical protein AJ80_02193 [Polytolypa hystricis UAMH7299]